MTTASVAVTPSRRKVTELNMESVAAAPSTDDAPVAADAPVAPQEDPARAAQARAARASMEGNLFTRLRIAAGALRGLMRDPEDTNQVFVLGLSLSRQSFPRLLALFSLEDNAGRLLREQPSIDSQHVDYDYLRSLPADTLGGAYARFLDSHDLDPDMFQAPPGLPEIPAYLAKRMRQSHDIWHVLTGCETDVPGEIELQAFTYGQTRMPLSLAICGFGTLRWGLRHPSLLARVPRAFRRGARAQYLPAVIWEERWEQPLSEARAELGLGG